MGGDQPLTIAEGAGCNLYRFLSFEAETLKPKAPISLRWNSPGAAREKTSYMFEPPAR